MRLSVTRLAMLGAWLLAARLLATGLFAAMFFAPRFEMARLVLARRLLGRSAFLPAPASATPRAATAALFARAAIRFASALRDLALIARRVDSGGSAMARDAAADQTFDRADIAAVVRRRQRKGAP